MYLYIWGDDIGILQIIFHILNFYGLFVLEQALMVGTVSL